MEAYVRISSIIPADEDYKKKLAVLHACREADIEPPMEIQDFFNLEEHGGDYEPDADGMEEMEDPSYIEISGDIDWEEGVTYDIDVQSIPKNVKTIRVWAGYC